MKSTITPAPEAIKSTSPFVPAKSTIGLRYLGVAHFFLFIFIISCGKEQKAPAPQSPQVEVAEVIQEDVPVYQEWIGTTDGYVNAVIRAQVQGYLIKKNYNEGELVQKGKILFEIDPRPFLAALNQAKGQLARQEAQWRTATANLARIEPLAKINAVSKRDLDDAIGAARSAEAQVAAAKAGVENAKVQVGFTKIKSPINGVAGIARAQIGDLVGPGQAELTTVSTLNPIKVYIALSEQEYLRAAEKIKASRNRSLEQPTKIELILADGSVFNHSGRFSFADRQVDPTTGTLRVAILFPNPGNILRPGQYAKVRAITQTRRGALLVPQRAVTELQGSYQVTVVNPDNSVAIRAVKPSDRIDGLWVIDQGIKAGERVIAEGVQKVKPGMRVVPRPYQPRPQPVRPGPQAASPDTTK